MTLLCLSIIEKVPKRLLEKIQKAKNLGAEVIEIWLSEIDLPENERSAFFAHLVKEAKETPLLAVCKGKKEKGSFSGSDHEKAEMILLAAKMGFSYLDVPHDLEPSALEWLLREKPATTKALLSIHFWDGTPSIQGLLRSANTLSREGVEIIKIATTARNIGDIVTLFRFAEKLIQRNIPHIVVAMGEKGKISRFFAPLLGNVMTFAALDTTSATAPGQIPGEDLRSFWEKQQIRKE